MRNNLNHADSDGAVRNRTIGVNLSVVLFCLNQDFQDFASEVSEYY